MAKSNRLYKRYELTEDEIQFIEETIKIVKADNAERLSKMNIHDAKEFAAKCKNDFFIEEQCKKLALVRYFENLPNQV